MKLSNVIVAVAALIGSVGFGHADALTEACEAYHSGDLDTAYRTWRPLADAGDSRGQAGMALLAGKGLLHSDTPHDFQHWATLAANQGNGLACWWLYRRNWTRDSTEEQRRTALEWLRKSSDGGFAEGALELGMLHKDGSPPAFGTNCDAAVMHLKRAAELGEKSAQTELAYMYRNGQCVQQSDDRAAHYALLAGGHGDPIAAELLAGMFAEGRGVPKDPFMAIVFLGVVERTLQQDSVPLAADWPRRRFKRAMAMADDIAAQYEKTKHQWCP